MRFPLEGFTSGSRFPAGCSAFRRRSWIRSPSRRRRRQADSSDEEGRQRRNPATKDPTMSNEDQRWLERHEERVKLAERGCPKVWNTSPDLREMEVVYEEHDIAERNARKKTEKVEVSKKLNKRDDAEKKKSKKEKKKAKKEKKKKRKHRDSYSDSSDDERRKKRKKKRKKSRDSDSSDAEPAKKKKRLKKHSSSSETEEGEVKSGYDSDSSDGEHKQKYCKHQMTPDKDSFDGSFEAECHEEKKKRSSSSETEEGEVKSKGSENEEDEWEELTHEVRRDAAQKKKEEEAEMIGPALPEELLVKSKREKMSSRAGRGTVAQMLADFIARGKRISRCGEIGLSSKEILEYQKKGFVMNGTRHKSMEATRLRLQNDVLTAEGKKLLSSFTQEERKKKEETVLQQFRDLIKGKKKL